MPTTSRVLLSLLLGSLPLCALAAPSGVDEEALLMLYGDEEMISIATGSRQPIAKAPAVATVITSDEIKAIGATDLDEVLETVPGLHVSRSHIGYNPIYSIRGVYSEFNPQVLMLINGIPVNNLFYGDRNQAWGGMPVEGIARIEVIRGPGSAIYGADAFAGVINIITKGPADLDGAEVGGRVGSFNTRDAWGLYGGKLGGFDMSLSLEYHRTDGADSIVEADAQTLFDGGPGGVSFAPGSVNLQRENLDARLELARDKWRFRVGLQDREGGNGAGVAQALDPYNRMTSQRWLADLTYQDVEFAENWDVTAQLSYLDTSQEVKRDLRLFPLGAVLPVDADGNFDPTSNTTELFEQGYVGNPEVFERHYRAELSGFYSGIARHKLRFGLGAFYGDIYKVIEKRNYGAGVPTSELGGDLVDVSDTPDTFLPEDSRTNYHAFAQDVWNLANDWELTTGVRYDHYSDFGDTVNPRVALVWSTKHNLTSKLMYGRAFRAPSFAETRVRNNPVALGNPDLEPETIETVELAFDHRVTERFQWGLNLFRYWWEDIILFEDSAEGRTAQNAGEQTGYGAEVEAYWQATHDLRLAGNYAYQQATDERSGEAPGYTPEHQAYLRAEWAFRSNWLLSPQVTWIGERKRAPADSRPALDGYTLVDLTLRKARVFGDFEAALSVRNLFDEDAREPSLGVPAAIPDDLPLAGRSVYGELRYQF